MTTGSLMPQPKQQFLTPLGTPLVGGKIWTYASGTTNPLATYTDPACTTAQPNPIPLNARGEPTNTIFWSGSYRVVLQDALGNTIYTVDNFTDNLSAVTAMLAALQLADYAALRAYSGPQQRVYVTGYLATAAPSGIAGDFVRDDSDAITADDSGMVIVDAAGRRWKRVRGGGVNPVWYGADPTTYADSTAFIQAAINAAGAGGTIELPKGVFKVNGTLNLLQGQILRGVGWTTVTGSFAVRGGSVIKQFSTADIPTINVPGTSESDQYENVHIRDLAVVNNVSAQNASGIHATYARKFKISNVYVTGFRRGVYLETQCWAWGADHCLIMDCNYGIYAGSASEDCLIANCDIGLFRSNGAGATEGTHCIYLTNQIQNCTILSTGMHFCDWALTMNQGDTNGNGTGTPYAMQASMIGCYIEDCKLAAVAIVSSNGAYNANAHPTFNMQDTRVYNGGAYAPINNGQPILYIAHASQVRVTNIQETGFSYGAIIGQSYSGYFWSGNQPKMVEWGIDNAYTYGTARFLGKTGCVSRVPGTSPMSIIGTDAASIALSGGFGNPQWNTAISDPNAWANLASYVIAPGKSQMMRIRAAIYVNATVNGARYAVILNKNGVQLSTFADITATGTGPLLLQGECYDTPNGSGDYYAVQVYCSSGASIPLTANGSYFSIEAIGS